MKIRNCMSVCVCVRVGSFSKILSHIYRERKKREEKKIMIIRKKNEPK